MFKRRYQIFKNHFHEEPSVAVMLGFFVLIVSVSVFMAGSVFVDSYGHYILWQAGYARDVEVLDANNALWQGKAEYVRSRVEDLVRISRELKFFDQKIIPIAIRQQKLNGALARAYIDPSRIAIDPVFFIGAAVSVYDDDDIDGILGHEFAHLIAGYIGSDHGRIWQETCVKLVDGLIADSRIYRTYAWCNKRAPTH